MPHNQSARWLTKDSAAIAYDFPTGRAFYQWAKRNSLPCAHRGRVLIFWSADIDKAIGADQMVGSEHAAAQA